MGTNGKLEVLDIIVDIQYDGDVALNLNLALPSLCMFIIVVLGYSLIDFIKHDIHSPIFCGGINSLFHLYCG